MPHCTLTKGKHIQHLLSTYAKIKQIKQWAQWVCIQEDKFEGVLRVSQDFMNLASMKYSKVASSDAGFLGSSKTITKDMVMMVSSLTGKHKAGVSPSTTNSS